MPNKYTELNSKKKKDTSSSQTSIVPVTTKVELKKHFNSTPASNSVGLHDQTRKKTSKTCRFITLSLAAYLGYNVLYGCGSPYDITSPKPLVCSVIDPIKLDFYSIYNSHAYQANIDPYVSPVTTKVTKLYHQYGTPVHSKLNVLYLQHGKHVVDTRYAQAQQAYEQQIAPLVNPYVGQAKHYSAQAKQYTAQAKQLTTQAQPYIRQALAYQKTTQKQIQRAWESLPPPVLKAAHNVKATICDLYRNAEETDLEPYFVKAYWCVVDFYQDHVLPVLQHSHTAKALQHIYNDHLRVHVDQHLSPVWASMNRRTHLDKLWYHLLFILPSRPEESHHNVASTVASIVGQAKTYAGSVVSRVAAITNEIPITTTVSTSSIANLNTVTVSTATKKNIAPTPIVPEKLAAVTKSGDNKKEDHEPDFTAATTSVTHTFNGAHATIGKYGVKNDEDIIDNTSVAPAHTHNHASDDCLTCNPEKEQMMVAPHEKDLHVVNADKDLHVVNNDKNVHVLNSEKEVRVVPAKESSVANVDATAAVPTSPNAEAIEKERKIAADKINERKEEKDDFDILKKDEGQIVIEALEDKLERMDVEDENIEIVEEIAHAKGQRPIIPLEKVQVPIPTKDPVVAAEEELVAAAKKKESTTEIKDPVQELAEEITMEEEEKSPANSKSEKKDPAEKLEEVVVAAEEQNSAVGGDQKKLEQQKDHIKILKPVVAAAKGAQMVLDAIVGGDNEEEKEIPIVKKPKNPTQPVEQQVDIDI